MSYSALFLALIAWIAGYFSYNYGWRDISDRKIAMGLTMVTIAYSLLMFLLLR